MPGENRGGFGPLSEQAARDTMEVIREVMEDGFPFFGSSGKNVISAKTEAAKRIGIGRSSLDKRLMQAEGL